MSPKKWTITVLAAVLLSLGAFAAIERLLDPLLQYGPENRLLTSYEYTELYSNPGIARQYSYDAVLVGTSMVENTSVDLMEELMDVKMVRLPYSGGTTFNMKTILDLCYRSGNTIRNVFWELDEFQLFGEADTPRYPLPDYLYRSSGKPGPSYLLNADIFYHYSIKNCIATVRGQQQRAARRGISFEGDYSRASMMKAYSRPQPGTEQRTFSPSFKAKVDANLENILSLVNAHPETEFVFFMPPFSILYWDSKLRSGTFQADMEAVAYALGEILSCNNARVFFFHDEEALITNLDNYKDYSHYGPWINDTITEYIAAGKGEITRDNYLDALNAFREFVQGYDFDAIFS